MKKKSILFLSFLLFSIAAWSQNTEKGFKALKENDFEKAASFFQKAVEKNEDALAAKLGLALVYENPLYSKYSFDKAFRVIVYVEKKIDKSSTLKELEKYAYTKNDVISIKNEISEKAFAKLPPNATVYQLNTFISKYEGMPLTEKAKEKRNILAFDEAQKENSLTSYQKFFETYTDAPQAETAKERFEQIWRNLYTDAAADGELSSLNEFNKQYPDYPFFDAKSHEDDSLALVASQLNFAKTVDAQYEKQVADYLTKSAPRELAFVSLQRLLESKLKAKQFTDAVLLLKKYQTLFPNDMRIAEMIKILEAPDKTVQVSKIGNKINTVGWEYAPSLTADMKKLYFCGRNRDSNTVADNEDIFVSEFENNEWQIPSPVHSLNTVGGHEAPLSISADGNTMLLYFNSDIYFSQKQTEGWSRKQKFPSVNENISWEADAMLSADGNAILFISDRQGNIGKYHPFSNDFHGSSNGNTDIYVSLRTENGWSEPKNIGAGINTPFSERSPFLHPDMKTLYFSSEGHASLGRLDVFKSTRLSDTSWTQWSEPVNLGKEINGSLDEYDYEISTDGNIAVFTAYKNFNVDIYSVFLPAEMKPSSVTTVSGHIIDQNGKQLDAGVKWENLANAELIGNLRSNPTNGTYIIVLPNGKNYGFFAEKQGYYPVAGNLDLKNININQNIQKDIVLVSTEEIISKNVSVTMNNLFFEYNKFDLKAESFSELSRFADFLKSQPNLKAEISGYTDNKGSADYNLELSRKRAESVKDYLVKLGCGQQKLTAVGFGMKKPVASNDTEEGRAKNRRVEFKISAE